MTANRMRLVAWACAAAIASWAACSGSSTTHPDSNGSSADRTCTGAVYDPCTDGTQCMSMNCHLYNGAGIQVCTTTCSASVPCPIDATGSAGFCNNMGSCKPAQANDCTP